MNTLLNSAFNKYQSLIGLITADNYSKLQDCKSYKEFKDCFMFMTSVEVIIATSSLSKINVVRQENIIDKNSNEMLICIIEDNDTNKELLSKAKKEQEQYLKETYGKEDVDEIRSW